MWSICGSIRTDDEVTVLPVDCLFKNKMSLDPVYFVASRIAYDSSVHDILKEKKKV